MAITGSSAVISGLSVLASAISVATWPWLQRLIVT